MASQPNDKLIIGLTGGIGSGKSAAATFFKNLGVTVVDADIASREVVVPGSEGLTKIAAHFGDRVLTYTEDKEHYSLNRKALRDIIFSDNDERQWLNQLLHPLIKVWMDDEIKAAPSSFSASQYAPFPYAIKVIPLLVETHNQQQVDRILVIEADPSIQLSRVSARDQITNYDVEKIIQTQATQEERNNVCDDKIINNSSLADLELAVEKMHNKYLVLAEQF